MPTQGLVLPPYRLLIGPLVFRTQVLAVMFNSSQPSPVIGSLLLGVSPLIPSRSRSRGPGAAEG